MSSEAAITVEDLNKCYHIYDSPRDRLRQMLMRGRKKYYHEFWALRGVTFEVAKGETMGILGRNGSGKSTLLQLICGTLNPTSGQIKARGRIAALLELGSGFNPEFTGRENVFLNGSILGLSQKEIEDRFDDIVAFADIGEFLEQPVKTYSSGMFVRLAFAVNIMSTPEIMVVDEALAVGDINFQAKCMTALTRIQRQGSTVLFVSHDLSAIKSLCDRAIYLESGQIRACGKAPDIAELYLRLMREEMNEGGTGSPPVRGPSAKAIASRKMQPHVASASLFKRSAEFDRRVAAHRYGSGGSKISYVELLDMDDNPLQYVEFNQKIKIKIYVKSDREQFVSVVFNIRDDKKINLVGCGFKQAGQGLLKTMPKGYYVVEYMLRFPFQNGDYSLWAQITSPKETSNSADFIDVVPDAVVFRMEKRPQGQIWSKVHLFPELQVTALRDEKKEPLWTNPSHPLGNHLLILGVQKAGTTSLFNVMSKITGFCGADEKEVGYFSRDKFYQHGTDWYLQHFSPCDKHMIRFEATPEYIYYPQCPGRISQFNPETKFIVIFREPASRCYSSWSMFKRFNMNGAKDIYYKFTQYADEPSRKAISSLLFSKKFPSFKKAVMDDIERHALRSSALEPSFVRRGIYHEQIMRYLEYFDISNFLFLEQSELNSSEHLMNRLAEFLETDIDERCFPTVEVCNASGSTNITDEEKEMLDYLKKFYAPHNEKLFKMIGADFLW